MAAVARAVPAKCQVAKISEGGYFFYPPWEIPHGAKGRLHVGRDTHFFPLKRRTKWTFEFGPSASIGLSTFLSYLYSHSLWRTATRKSIACHIVLGDNAKTAQSAKLELVPPVAPYTGKLGTINLKALGTNAPIQYVGTGAHPFIGRMLHKPIDSRYFFKYAGRLETDLTKRGFDCITYVGSVFGAQSHMDKKGKELAEHLGATAVAGVPDDSAPATVYKHFAKSGEGDGTYVLWSGGHTVIVHDKTVHEFQAPAPRGEGKYVSTPVLEWLAEGKRNKYKYGLRKSPKMVSS